jgi:hypothetical protein
MQMSKPTLEQVARIVCCTNIDGTQDDKWPCGYCENRNLKVEDRSCSVAAKLVMELYENE